MNYEELLLPVKQDGRWLYADFVYNILNDIYTIFISNLKYHLCAWPINQVIFK
jgi:hypothetical protein